MTFYCTKRPFSTTLVWIGLLFVSLMWTGCTDVEPFEADMRSGNASKRALKREVMSMEMVAEGGLTLPDLFKTWSAENSSLLLSLGSGDISMKWAESEYYDTGGAEILMTPIASDYKVALRRVTMEKKRRRVEMASMYSYLYVKKSKMTGRKVDYVISFSPDRRYMKKHKTDLASCFHYDLRKTDFTGYYLVSKNDGTFLYGIRYDNGKECFRVYPRDRAPRSTLRNASVCPKPFHFDLINGKMNTRSLDDDNETEIWYCSFCHKPDLECECFVVTPTPDDGDEEEEENGQTDPLPDKDDDSDFEWGSGGSSSSGGSGGGGGSSVGGGGGGGSTGGIPTVGLPNVIVTAAKMKSTAQSVFAGIKGSAAQCNIGVANMFEQIFGFPMTSPRPLANEMIKFWQESDNWTKISLAEAVEMVNKGYFVVAGWINPKGDPGHVVVLLPGQGVYREAWGGKIPYCMDTGPQGIRSECHLISGSFGRAKIENVVFYYYNR